MSIRQIISSALVAGLIFSCSESPFLSKEEAERIVNGANEERDPFRKVTNVVAIINNDIYYFEDLFTAPRRLTNTPLKEKTHVKLSFDKSRVAYINDADIPVVIRTSDGAHLQTLTEYQYVKQIEWAKDRLTLILLRDNDVFSEGESITLPSIETNYPFPWDVVNSFSMNAAGDYGYLTDVYSQSADKLVYASPGRNILKEGTFYDGDFFNYIDLFGNDGGFLLGKKYSSDPGFTKVICVLDYDNGAAYEWDEEEMMSPEFHPGIEVLLYGTAEGSTHYIKAVYLGTELYPSEGWSEILSRLLSDYPSTSQVYVDWSY